MGELQLKYIEIIFDKQSPQNIGSQIDILTKIESHEKNLEYKFIVGKGGIWNTIQEFSDRNECSWEPKIEGEYMVMVQAREKDGKKPLDYLAREEFTIEAEKIVENVDHEILIEKCVNDDISSVSFINNENNLDDKVIFIGVRDEISKSLESYDLNERNIESNDNADGDLNIIKEIIIEKEEIMVSEKCTIEVKTIYEDNYLYRFFIKKYKEWSIVRDYDINNILRYTATEAGEKEFLIQCKKINSTDNFQDFRIAKINVLKQAKIEITNFKSLTNSLRVGEKLGFEVETNIDAGDNKKEAILLYKFYKIYKDGKSVCIQDYSTDNKVFYYETDPGSYKVLCLVKEIFSNKEYDDRALIFFDIKPYDKILINNFSSEFSSPQKVGSHIKFFCDVEGGTNLLYRYKVNGIISEDTGYLNKDQFIWKPVEAGEYEILLFVKNDNCKDEFEDSKKIMFSIEKKEDKPIKIVDIVIDNEKKIIINEPVNLMVATEGGTKLQYAFKVKKNHEIIENIEYDKSNWINFIPKEAGEYSVEIMVRDQYSNKEYDTKTNISVRVMEYLPAEIDYIILPSKEIHLIGDDIEVECIIQNAQNTIVKYEIIVNGKKVKETEFTENKKFKFIPEVFGKYTINVYAKDLKCINEFDSNKKINLYVNEASPVIETKIIANNIEGYINEDFIFEVISKGGKNVFYEFYLMENYQWKKVQEYSQKNYYGFKPIAAGKYKLLALARSHYKSVGYEDYDQIEFSVKMVED